VAGTVLYIDDSPELPRGTAEELSRLGFRLKHTRDPEEGLRWAREGLSRMVLLEVLLPDHDGWEILQELGTCRGSAGELPVLILTRGERTPGRAHAQPLSTPTSTRSARARTVRRVAPQLFARRVSP
jgi:DNA-binding response OmpR family regulator